MGGDGDWGKGKGKGKGKPSSEGKPRIPCMFGALCQRKEWNAEHRAQFAHPGDHDYDVLAASKQIRPSCKYGGKCSNTKKEHWEMFSHPPDKDYVQHAPQLDVPDNAMRFEGEISRYQQQGDWGFIRCAALSGMLGMTEDEKAPGGSRPKDLYFTKKNSNAKQLSIGQTVTFVLKEENNNGKPEAIRVEVVQPPDDPPDATRHHGLISSFIKESTWGFITCPAAKTGQDIWFHLKDTGGCRIWTGMGVTFILDEKRRPGRPEAVSIKPSETSEDPAGLQRVSGMVKSLIDTGNSPYGFIEGKQDDSMDDKIKALIKAKDFFFHQRDCAGAGKLYEGAEVTFLLDERSQNSAKPHAIRVKMVDPNSAPKWARQVNQPWNEYVPGSEWEEEPDPFEMMGMMMGMMGMMKGKDKGKGKDDPYGKGKGDDWYGKGKGDDFYGKGKGKGDSKGKGKDDWWGESAWGQKRPLEQDGWGEAPAQEWAPAAPAKPASNVPMGVRKMIRKD